MEKRHGARSAELRLQADISDGKNSYAGIVTNLSRFGMLLENVPESLIRCGKTLYLNVHEADHVYQLWAMPRWVSAFGERKKMGLQIFYAPRQWFAYMDDYEQHGGLAATG